MKDQQPTSGEAAEKAGSAEPKCESSCKIFTGGEIRHHKDCVFYPESFSEMYDLRLLEQSEESQEDLIEDFMNTIDPHGSIIFTRDDVEAAKSKFKITRL